MVMRKRDFLGMAGAFVGLGAVYPAFAAQTDSDAQAEWRQSYEEASNLAVPRSTVPMLSSDSFCRDRDARSRIIATSPGRAAGQLCPQAFA